MIGLWLNALTNTAAQDALLTEKLRPGMYYGSNGRCLVGTAGGFTLSSDWVTRAARRGFRFDYGGPLPLELRFDSLCQRFGVERITAAIRSRILTNRARRTLRPVSDSVTA